MAIWIGSGLCVLAEVEACASALAVNLCLRTIFRSSLETIGMEFERGLEFETVFVIVRAWW